MPEQRLPGPEFSAALAARRRDLRGRRVGFLHALGPLGRVVVVLPHQFGALLSRVLLVVVVVAVFALGDVETSRRRGSESCGGVLVVGFSC